MGVFGLVALAAGIVVLVWPMQSAKVLTGIFAVYVIVAGIVYVAAGLFTRGISFGARFWRVVLGALLVAAGVIGLSTLATTAAAFLVIMTILVGITWIYEGFVAFATLGSSGAKGWTVFYAIVSILAGLTILFTPLFAAVSLWWLIGVMAVVFGIIQIVQAFTMRSPA